MDNFVQFLVDKYVIILIILGVIIITIIGFLVDSKQKRKKKEMANATNEVKTVESLPNEKTEQTTVSEVKAETSTPIEQASTNVEQVPSVEQTSQGQSNQELTLSEQKPHFESKEVQIPTPVNQPVNVVAPKPVNAVPIMQPQAPNLQSQPTPMSYQNVAMPTNVNPKPSVIQPTQTLAQQPVQPQVSQNQNYNQAVTNGMVQQNQVNRPVQPVNQTPSQPNIPVNPVQTPVNYQNVAMPSNGSTQPNMTQTVQTLAQQPVQSQVQQPVQQPTPTQNIGISFVTGENNAPSDDAWKL